jgi:exodeoxyribonuclease VII small subunit
MTTEPTTSAAAGVEALGGAAAEPAIGAGAATYETAVERLEEIIRRLDSGQAGLRETLELCKEGKGLIEFAAGELDAVGQGLQELRLDDLIARLEATPSQAAA